MLRRILFFLKDFGFLLVYSKKQIYPLIALFSNLRKYDQKSALSILFLSVESLSSVIRYQRSGTKTLQLIDEKDRVEENNKSLFILGSGPTVNEHTEEEWEHIGNNDSWGFNVWFCHDFVPSTYIAQALVEPKKNSKDTFPYSTNIMLRKMLDDRKEDYINTTFFIRGDAVNKHKFYKTEFGSKLEGILGRQGALFAEMPVGSTNKISPSVLLDNLHSLGFFQINREVQIIPKFGSTITELISLALMLGYKEIVLCGIDMNDGGHFYDNEESFQRYPYLRQLSNINHTRTPEGGHEHMDSTSRPYTIKEYIVALRKFAKEKFGAEIYVMREKSALYPEIPKYTTYV